MPPLFRSLARQWKITGISVFSLAVAMALGILALSVSNTLVLLPPSAPNAGQLVAIYGRDASKGIDPISWPDYEYFRQNNRVFSGIAATPNSIGLSANVDSSGREVKVVTRPVSADYFKVLGIYPILGQFFSPGDDRSKEHLAVMTWSCWKRLGADPKIVGQEIAGHKIIGVAPKEFTGSFFGVNGDLLTNVLFDDPAWYERRSERHAFLIARMKPGVTRRQAQTEMAALAGQLASAYPQDNKGRTAVVTRASLLPPDSLADAQSIAGLLLASVLLVLLIACANVANLLLAAAVARRREAAIKMALGAGRGRLIREFLWESAALCTCGGAAGYALAAMVVKRYSEFTFVFPMWGAFSFAPHLRLDGAVLGFTLVLIVIASVATGVVPAMYASSPALAQMIGSEAMTGGRQRSLRRNALLIVQVATCTLVLVGAGLCERSLHNLRGVDPGFSARQLVAVTVFVESEGYKGERAKAFYQTLRQTAGTIPGVESVALATNLPLMGGEEVPAEMADGRSVNVSHTVVDQSFFSTFGIRIVEGRAFDASDREGGRPVAIVNRKMAETYWPGADAIGKVLKAGGQSRTVVGVVADGKYDDLDEAPKPYLYYPLSQNYRGAITLVARTSGDPRRWLAPVQQALRGLGLTIMIQPVTLESWMGLTLFTQRLAAAAGAGLSVLALLLAVVGLFAIVSYSVSERRKELGIRIALGALPWQLQKMVLRQTGLIAGAGVAMGLTLGVGATIVFRSQFYGVGAVEATVLVPVAAAMMGLSMVISYCSARPWVRVDPLEAVRHL